MEEIRLKIIVLNVNQNLKIIIMMNQNVPQIIQHVINFGKLIIRMILNVLTAVMDLLY